MGIIIAIAVIIFFIAVPHAFLFLLAFMAIGWGLGLIMRDVNKHIATVAQNAVNPKPVPTPPPPPEKTPEELAEESRKAQLAVKREIACEKAVESAGAWIYGLILGGFALMTAMMWFVIIWDHFATKM